MTQPVKGVGIFAGGEEEGREEGKEKNSLRRRRFKKHAKH
jgi:hypothetical protein